MRAGKAADLIGECKMAMMTKWQRMAKADADRAYARWDMLRGETERRVALRRAWFVMGHKKSAPIRKF